MIGLIVLRARLVETRPLDVVRDAWRAITRAAYKAVGQYWVDNMLQRHFQPGAASKYRYASRSQAYLLRKYGTSHTALNARGIPRQEHYSHLRNLDDQQPLQLTGYMRRAVSSQYVIRGFPTRATIILYGPAYMTARLSRSSGGKSANDKSKYTAVQPDKVREMTTVTAEERRELAKVLEAELLKQIDSYRATKVTE